METEQGTQPAETQHMTAAVARMKAIVQDSYGEAENVLRLAEIDRPEIGTDEVLLQGVMRPASIGGSGI